MPKYLVAAPPARDERTLREKNDALTKDTVLDACERLLASGDGDFSMRELAAEAGMGFATPFNHFGSKNAIIQGVSARVIARMAERFRSREPRGDAIDRVLTMGEVAIGLLLDKPAVFKAVVGSLGVVSKTPAAVHELSAALWSEALAGKAGIRVEFKELATTVLPAQLAYAFRGCLSFWIAGELGDKNLNDAFAAAASLILLGIAQPKRQAALAKRINASARRR